MPAVVPMASLLTPSLPCEGAGQSGTACLFPRGDEMEATAHRLGGFGGLAKKSHRPVAVLFWRINPPGSESLHFGETKPPPRSRRVFAKQSHRLGAAGFWQNKATSSEQLDFGETNPPQRFLSRIKMLALRGGPHMRLPRD